MKVVWTGLIVAALVATGCGSSEKKETSEATGGRGGAAVAAGGSGPLTEADCDRLLDHWLELYISDRKKTAKPEEVPTEEDVAKTRQRMAPMRDKCIGAPRAPFDCSMRAETIDQAKVCLEGGKAP